MKLYIDTANAENTLVRLDDDELLRGAGERHSQAVIPLIEELLKKNGKTLKDITDVEVNTGPGSFTGLRVGAAIANALGFALKIPVNGKKPWELDIALPEYSTSKFS